MTVEVVRLIVFEGLVVIGVVVVEVQKKMVETHSNCILRVHLHMMVET